MMMNRKHMQRRDNLGFTLIELIIVMAIVAILLIGTSVSYNMLGFGSAFDTAKRIKSDLEYVQIQNMTKSETYYLVIEKTEDRYYLSVEKGLGIKTLISKEKLDLKNGEISFQNNGSSTEYLIGSTISGNTIKLEVRFVKNTGAVGKNSDGDMITNINITAAGSTYHLRLAQTTGKISVKN